MPSGASAASLDDEQLPTPTNGDRNLSDWIMELKGSTASDGQRSIVSIRDAEFAAFKIRERNKSRGRSAPPADERAVASQTRSEAESKRSGKRISFTTLEQDHTIARRPGQLGCPFAGMQPPPSSLRKENSRHDLPTPRSSGSNIEFNESRSRRQSFNDPLRPEVIPDSEPSDEESEQGSNGPACPIRFLDQHSPEDVAKYFEEHKHELPQSHAACVKRFETNSDSIKQLDAKYGSLVTMIQGLGQKHQPMLPEAPQPIDASVVQEDGKSTRKIKKWVRGVSEEPRGRPDGPERADTGLKAQSVGADEERVPYFDRELKEVRVGESPSRPWGVPVPLKYLDRAESDHNVDLDEPEASMKNNPGSAKMEHALPPPDQGLSKSAARGQCPFDHGQGKAPPTPQQEVNIRPVVDVATNVTGTATSPQTIKDTDVVAKQSIPLKITGARIINHGTTFISNTMSLPAGTLENRGTLMMGYSLEEAQKILAQFPERQ